MNPEKRPEGRPSKYKPEYCEQIIKFCSEGYSITGFAGSIGVCRDTIVEWARVHPEFSLAVQAAKAAAAYSYEKDAKRIRTDGGGPGSATIVLFGLKNMAPDDYSDKQQLEHSGPDGAPIQAVNMTVSEYQEVARKVIEEF